ncbi:MAG: DSD1 family PLP-dependent enzyme [Nitrospinaceae bacterium]|jgi:3-hydroxy-D-aspartate aldolase|nr:DSD1 family PLP-dependent enzyme [Nitrospinaceae bacterium]MBT3432469.1 DSD1 family PLP-dependent enzyme [Nitrospinaceae bacterium]MBT4431197.1 DSD1 family PLP-dependent enzyme [Nitrospinaceae bacterium]MBT5368771.1 DSD1 family PLP-dependent enzyme [Nitrospinaceae bacterium]MBT5947092.1 DSD1 family PLP-dependent enzyme [Nitrospinaceae bacterium]
MSENRIIGMPVRELDTPALLIDLDAMERNLGKMSERLAGSGLRLRAHSKTHKSPILARKQMALGAVGVCCQKVSEAEVMVAGGVEDILVSSEVVSLPKLRRLMALTRHARVMVVVDDPRGAELLSEAAREAKSSISVLVDVDVGQGRCGVPPGVPAAEVGKFVASLPGLEVKGIQAYEGKAQHVDGFEARRKVYEVATRRIQDTVEEFNSAGLSTEIKSGGGTGSWRWDLEAGVLTELQSGSYLFMDAHYCSVGGPEGAVYDDFEASLFVLTTVVSTPASDRVVVDGGHKSLSSDSGWPLCLDINAAYSAGGDEHGNLTVPAGSPRPDLGDILLFQPSHCDTTINLHDVYYGIRGGMQGGILEAIWPVAARGMVQ